MLALVAEEIKSDAALVKAVAKAGQVLPYDVTKRKLPEWVAEQFGRYGAKADADACRALVDMVGDDLDELTERDREACDLGGGRHDHAARRRADGGRPRRDRDLRADRRVGAT